MLDRLEEMLIWSSGGVALGDGSDGLDVQGLAPPPPWRNEDPEPRVGVRGVQPKAEKKIVTSPILMVKVVVDVPKGTSDGSPGVRDMFESL